MFNNVALDVFIGLVFIFLLYSLLATIIQEILAQWFCFRARLLVKAIRRMLEDEQYNKSNYFKNSSIAGFADSFASLFSRFFRPVRENEKLIKTFYDHPTIKYLGENRLFSKPAYLHSHNFSQTILQLLRGDQYDGRFQSESNAIEDNLRLNTLNVKPETLRHLKLLFADARQDSYLFKLKLEDWFDETMQRCSGWYKKQTQIILVILGFCIASSFNVDTIAISKILLKDKNAREQLVQLAISRQKDYGVIVDSLTNSTVTKTELKKDSTTVTTTKIETKINTPTQSYLDTVYKTLSDDAATVQGILGLNGLPSLSDSSDCKKISVVFDSIIAKEPKEANKSNWEKIKNNSIECCYTSAEKTSPYQQSGGLKFLGWLITALAISLGSSFWFDLLNKLIKLRGAGPQPNSKADSDVSKNIAINPGKDNSNMDIKG